MGVEWHTNYCSYEAAGQSIKGHKDYIDDIASRGLNVFRMWIALNHSPGEAWGTTTNLPFTNEQPFVWNGSTQKWNVAAGTWDNAFFNHVYDVISYAATKGVFVEVTLFDPWSGDWTKGPWYSPNIYNGTGFSTEQEFVSLPSGGNCTAFSSGPRKRQVDFMKKLASTINSLDNFYWEIANEPDISSVNGLSGTQVAAWHDCMIQELYNYEGTLANARHMIGVNYHTLDAINAIKNNTYPSSSPKVLIVNGHYVDFSDSTRQGAMELIRNFHGGANGSLHRIFGFNESHITPSITQNHTVDTMRVEAWEFMLHEGGVYDHLGYQWDTAAARTVRDQLGVLKNFVNNLELLKMKRASGNPPAWLPGLPAYGSLDNPLDSGSPRIYWGAMEGPDYVLFLHHSRMTTGNFRHYTKPSSINRRTSLAVQMPVASNPYTAYWINPITGGTISTATIPAAGSATLTVPSYTYDIALKIVPGGIRSISSRSCHITCCAAY